MKKIILGLIFCIAALASLAQYPAGLQTLGNDSNVVKARGGFTASTIYVPSFTDTTAANAARYVSSYNGSVIRIGTDFYMRANGGWWKPGGSYIAGAGLVLQGTTFKVQDTSNGAGTKFIWMPSKSAFRAGYAGTSWDVSNIGNYSFAGNYDNIASGLYSASFGQSNLSSSSTAFSSGQQTTASGSNAFSSGQQTTASGSGSASFNALTKATGDVSTAIGKGTEAKGYGGTVIGMYNDTTTATDALNFNLLNRAFQIGIGDPFSGRTRRNAMTVLFNGKTTLNQYGTGTFTGTPAYTLQVDASGNIIEGSTSSGGTVNLTGPITSVGSATSITSQTGTGTTFAMSASPALTGIPAAPTATAGANTTQIATTAFVNAAITALPKDTVFVQTDILRVDPTASGKDSISLQPQTQNKFIAATIGAGSQPMTARTLVLNDLPFTLGTNLSYAGSVLNATGSADKIGEEATGATTSTITLANTPVTGTIKVYKNGIRLPAAKFSLTTATVTLTDARVTTDLFMFDYKY